MCGSVYFLRPEEAVVGSLPPPTLLRLTAADVGAAVAVSGVYTSDTTRPEYVHLVVANSHWKDCSLVLEQNAQAQRSSSIGCKQRTVMCSSKMMTLYLDKYIWNNLYISLSLVKEIIVLIKQQKKSYLNVSKVSSVFGLNH